MNLGITILAKSCVWNTGINEGMNITAQMTWTQDGWRDHSSTKLSNMERFHFLKRDLLGTFDCNCMVPGCELLGRHWQQLQEGTQGHTDFAVNNANNWAKKLMWIDGIYFIWTEPTLLGSTQHPYRSFSWTVWAQTSRSHKSARTLAENLSPCWKLGEFCEVFNSDEDEWLWDKDQQYVKKTYAAQAFGQTIVESWRLGILWYVGGLCEGYTLQICWTRCSWDPYQMTFPQFSKEFVSRWQGQGLQISTCPMMSSLWGTWSW